MSDETKPVNEEDQPAETGDKITIKDVGPGSATAAGRGARAELKIFNIDIRWLPVVAILLIIIGFLIYMLLPDKPDEMDKEFNVAVAEFTVLDESGKPVKNDDGQEIGAWIAERLENTLDSVDDLPFTTLVWPPDLTGEVKGDTVEEREEAAKNLAERINADIVVYGVITDTGRRSQWAPEFYVHHESFNQAEEIIDRHGLGSNTIVNLPFDRTQIQDTANPALSRRTQALSHVTAGLGYFAKGFPEKALEQFDLAQADDLWGTDTKGREVVYLLQGKAATNLAEQSDTMASLIEAEDYYSAALAIKGDYLRAMLGLASVLYLNALGPPTEDSIDPAGLAMAESAFLDAQKANESEGSKVVEAKIQFGLGQIYLSRFAGNPAAESGSLNEARTAFEQVISIFEDSDDLRLESLSGHSHARLGRIAWILSNHDDAANFYESAAGMMPDDSFFQHVYLGTKGDVHADAGNVEEAIVAYEDARQIAELLGDSESAEKYAAKIADLNTGG